MRRLALILVAAAAACSSSTGPKTPAFVGTWSLVSVDDAPLPDTVAAIGNIDAFLLMQDATLVLTDGAGTDSLIAHYHLSVSATIITNVDHVVPLDNGAEIEWLDHNDATDSITVRADTLVLTTSELVNQLHVYKFERSVP
ncbi:MAG TPA: hypothetical protein VJN96_04465 [Vicinamibacterales bacterium]|nr:hypothetical protein [Vicinamibacterales bacterium]